MNYEVETPSIGVSFDEDQFEFLVTIVAFTAIVFLLIGGLRTS